jgi:preprotein translocase subunit SecF
MRLFANANFDFLSRRRTALTLSGVVFAILLALSLVWQFSKGSWLNYNVDFTGGTIVQVHFNEPTTVGDLREIVAPVAAGTEITRFGADNEFLLRAPGFSEEGAAISDQIIETISGSYPEGAFEIVRTEAVGPKVGGELQQKAMLAIILSLIATLAYLAVRFEWRFGVAAVGSTAHDLILTVLIIAGFRLDVSLTTVAAVLTVVGYSLNDTIIVFDRVRENLKGAGRRMGLVEVLNRSINETLPRTVLTSATTLVTLLALFLIGGTMLQEFALILILGIVIATFSSIFIASPLLCYIEQRWPRAKEARASGRPARAKA